MLSVWFYSTESIKDSNSCGSELVLVWYLDDFVELPLSSIIRDAVHGIPWSDLAHDWYY